MLKSRAVLRKSRRSALLILIFSILFIIWTVPVFSGATKFKPIRGCHVVTDFPEVLTVGSSYEAYYRFRNIEKQEVQVAVHFTVREHTCYQVRRGEWLVRVAIDRKILDCDEVEPGVFESEECPVAPEPWHDLNISLALSQKITPSKYRLTTGLVWVVSPEKPIKAHIHYYSESVEYR